MKTSASYYRTVEWYNLTTQSRIDAHCYINGYLKKHCDNESLDDSSYGMVQLYFIHKAWRDLYNCVLENHEKGWRLCFYTKEGFTRFALEII